MKTRQEQIEEIKLVLMKTCKRCRSSEEDYMQSRYAEALCDVGYQILKQGKWLISERGCVITCSNCNERLEFYYPDGTEVGPALTYCPYCGSKNRKD